MIETRIKSLKSIQKDKCQRNHVHKMRKYQPNLFEKGANENLKQTDIFQNSCILDGPMEINSFIFKNLELHLQELVQAM